MKRSELLVLALGALIGAAVVVHVRSVPSGASAGARGSSPEGAPPAFDLCGGNDPLSTGKDEPVWNHALVFALLATLSGEDARGLARAVEEANLRWEARGNPFAEDLEGGDPDASLARWLKRAPPAAAAAVAAARPRYCAGDGFCVRVVPRETACPAGTRSLAESEIGRARFLAWPFGHAVQLRTPSLEAAARAAAGLRARARTSALIGLVIHRGDERVVEEQASALRDALVRHEVLRRRASRDSAPSGQEQPFDVRGDGGAESEGAFPAKLEDRDVLVLPRLAAVDRPGALVAEVRAAAGDLPVSEVVPAPSGR